MDCLPSLSKEDEVMATLKPTDFFLSFWQCHNKSTSVKILVALRHSDETDTNILPLCLADSDRICHIHIQYLNRRAADAKAQVGCILFALRLPFVDFPSCLPLSCSFLFHFHFLSFKVFISSTSKGKWKMFLHVCLFVSLAKYLMSQSTDFNVTLTTQTSSSSCCLWPFKHYWQLPHRCEALKLE